MLNTFVEKYYIIHICLATTELALLLGAWLDFLEFMLQFMIRIFYFVAFNIWKKRILKYAYFHLLIIAFQLKKVIISNESHSYGDIKFLNVCQICFVRGEWKFGVIITFVHSCVGFNGLQVWTNWKLSSSCQQEFTLLRSRIFSSPFTNYIW